MTQNKPSRNAEFAYIWDVANQPDCSGGNQAMGAETMSPLKVLLLLGMGALLSAAPALAEDRVPQPAGTAGAAPAAALPKQYPLAQSLSTAIAGLTPATADPERKDQEALKAFYEARGYAALWVTGGGVSAKAPSLLVAFKDADAYGLSPKDFLLPKDVSAAGTPDERAAAELKFSLAALTYARFARGGRIADPTALLTTQLDRRPQWIEPKQVLEGLAAAPDAGAYLSGLNPKHAQFEKLRQLYIAERAKTDGPKLSTAAKHLRANMEMWRWMADDMGLKTGDASSGMYVLNNIPEFMQYVYKDGQIVRSERIVAGKIDKQSSIFSRPLKFVVLRPMWTVPDSIKVNELWPSLRHGGGIMRKFGLEVQTKDGDKVNWHSIDWAKANILDYDVTQPPGPSSALGHVKFSFPSQHTIYMHDTPDKWMFNSAQRTLSHGCLRVRNPMALAEMILKEDKGWDKDKIAELDRSGPLNNEVTIDKRIPIHLVYFTAWVDDAGKLKTYKDIYGHEKRVIQALDGQWDKIDKGRDHLAPIDVNARPDLVASDGTQRDTRRNGQKRAKLSGGLFGDLLDLGW